MAAEFVAVLARILTRHGNRVGALFYGSDVDTRDPGAQRPPPRAAPAAPAARRGRNAKAATATDLGELLDSVWRLAPRRSLVFVVSDFISTPGWAEPLARLAPRHDVVAVRLYDPMEMALPDLGLVVIAGRGDRRAAVRRHARPRASASASPRPPPRREAELRNAFARRRRRRARARDRRRPRRHRPALRRPARRAQPPRHRRRPAAAPGGRTDEVPVAGAAAAAGAAARGRRRLPVAAAPQAQRRAALREPRGDEGRGRRGLADPAARAAGAVPRRARAAAGRGRPADRGRHAAVAARDGDPGDGRLGQHARDRRQADRASSPRRRRRRPSSRSSR